MENTAALTHLYLRIRSFDDRTGNAVVLEVMRSLQQRGLVVPDGFNRYGDPAVGTECGADGELEDTVSLQLTAQGLTLSITDLRDSILSQVRSIKLSEMALVPHEVGTGSLAVLNRWLDSE